MGTADQLLFQKWARRRDAQAFKSLTVKYAAMVYATCLRILRNSTEAEDVTQECFAALAGMKAGPKGSMGAWLHQVATKQALLRIRSEERRKNREARFAAQRQKHSEIQWDDLYEYVDEAVAALPDNVRKVIVAHFLEDQTVSGIALQEGVSHPAISQRIQKGIEGIRDALQKRGILVSGAALAAMLGSNAAEAQVVPASLSAALGKLALSGAGSAGAGTGLAATVFTPAKAAIATAVVLAASASIWVASREEPAVVPEEAAPSEPIEVDLTDPMSIANAYAQHQERIQRMTVAYEWVRSSDSRVASPAYSHLTGKKTTYGKGELSYDGERFLLRYYDWGQVSPTLFVPEHGATRKTILWDGHTYYQYRAQEGPPGPRGKFNPNLRAWPKDYAYLIPSRHCNVAFNRSLESMVRGVLTVRWDKGRIDELMAGAPSARVRADTELVGDAECYVVDAEMQYASLSVWFALNRDFNIAKYTLQIRQGHLAPDPGQVGGIDGVAPGASEKTYVTVDYANVDGLWIPKEATLEVLRVFTDDGDHRNGDYGRLSIRYKRTSIELNPDFDARGTFVMTGVAEGSSWRNATGAASGGTVDKTKYVWRDGKPVPK